MADGTIHPWKAIAKAFRAGFCLAYDLRALGEHRQARDLDVDTLTRRRRTLGDDNPDTLASATNLPLALRALGEHEQAEEWTSWAADRDRAMRMNHRRSQQGS